MQILKPGHLYVAQNHDNPLSGQTIQFLEKVPLPASKCVTPGELQTVNDGTTNEELLEILIDRLNHLNQKAPCRENSLAITKLQEAKFWLNERTRLRKARGVEGTAAP